MTIAHGGLRVVGQVNAVGLERGRFFYFCVVLNCWLLWWCDINAATMKYKVCRHICTSLTLQSINQKERRPWAWHLMLGTKLLYSFMMHTSLLLLLLFILLLFYRSIVLSIGNKRMCYVMLYCTLGLRSENSGKKYVMFGIMPNSRKKTVKNITCLEDTIHVRGCCSFSYYSIISPLLHLVIPNRAFILNTSQNLSASICF